MIKAVDAWIWQINSQENALHIVEEVTEDGSTITHDIALGAIASWRELLGYDDPMECLEAIIHVAKYRMPPCDPETGKNAFTDSYTLLTKREAAREDAAKSAVDSGANHDEIVAASAEAAYKAVHIPINGGECLMDRCRRAARDELGVKHPVNKCGEGSRIAPVEVPVKLSKVSRQRQSGPVDDERVAGVLSGREEEILLHTQSFLHGLSGHTKDYISPTSPDEEIEPPADPIKTADQLLTKYQEAS